MADTQTADTAVDAFAPTMSNFAQKAVKWIVGDDGELGAGDLMKVAAGLWGTKKVLGDKGLKYSGLAALIVFLVQNAKSQMTPEEWSAATAQFKAGLKGLASSLPEAMQGLANVVGNLGGLTQQQLAGVSDDTLKETVSKMGEAATADGAAEKELVNKLVGDIEQLGSASSQTQASFAPSAEMADQVLEMNTGGGIAEVAGEPTAEQKKRAQRAL